AGGGADGGVAVLTKPPVIDLETCDPLKVVGRPQPKVDGPRLVTGRPAFTDDVEVRGLLHARLLLSPHAHARIVRIDAAQARALPGVHAVLTHADLPRVSYTSAGQSWPEPSPHDMRSLDEKVRFVGDRVAAVAAETPEIAARALELIAVEYEVLPAVFDPVEAIAPGAPVIHDETDSRGFGHHDFGRNVAASIVATHGDVAQGFAQADLILERTYRVPKVQQTSIEPHVTITYFDEDDRLVVRTSTQVPFHVRRIIAPLIGLPMSRIRVIKPRIGGGFGGKQEVLIEDICAHLTIATGRPVKLEYSREEELMAARSRHPQVITMKTGVRRDGTLVASEMRVVADTGAYGSHALTVQSNTGVKVLPLYRAPHLRFECTTAYTNLPPSGAFRGYGVPQGAFAMECQMDEIARLLGIDPLELRRKNWVRVGDVNPLSKKMNEGKEGYAQEIHSCGLAECVAQGAAAIGWSEKRGRRLPGSKPGTVRGVGGAIAMQGSAIPGVD
ncbi:MAG TPA: molybdopterin cofactor-binding domain-containing protein, partial [Symbiobacteriaceae bacterium]|nr:molybdopterin cofactor-binding domain-containing protein [Symbiobacteriaceae bacterium]